MGDLLKRMEKQQRRYKPSLWTRFKAGHRAISRENAEKREAKRLAKLDKINKRIAEEHTKNRLDAVKAERAENRYKKKLYSRKNSEFNPVYRMLFGKKSGKRKRR